MGCLVVAPPSEHIGQFEAGGLESEIRGSEYTWKKNLLHCFDQHEFASGVQNQCKELPEGTPTEELSCCPETPVAGYLLLLFLFLGRKVLTG